jgi:hypothetical protein
MWFYFVDDSQALKQRSEQLHGEQQVFECKISMETTDPDWYY